MGRDDALAFEPPGLGAWSRDAERFPRPATRFVVELFPEAARRGFTEATARYGLLLDHVEWAFVHRWAYLSARPVAPLAGLPAQPSRQTWDELAGADAALRRRLATSARVFDEKRWRHEVAWWDEEAKPALRRAHDELQAVDLTSLTRSDLAAHLECCRDGLWQAVYCRHRLNVAPVLPVGDFLAHTEQWTGRPARELLSLLRQPTATTATGRPELDALVDALRGDHVASERVAGGEAPDRVLAFLRSRPGSVGRAATSYLEVAGDCSVGSGSDVSEPRLIELPSMLVQTLRAALQGGGGGHPGGELSALTAQVRADVPARWRVTFDELLAEANASHRLRDERATHGDVRAYGLARRAILAAGRRLADAGAVQLPEHVVEAGHDELQALLAGGREPSGEDLAGRARYRLEADDSLVPAVLGGPPRTPVPVEWLPVGADRTERALRTYLQAMADPEPAASISGRGASAGTWQGRACVVRTSTDLARLAPGDVLVTAAMTPAFTVALPTVGAIVTDRGGVLSHAAILAREHAVPAVVSTRTATTTIADGSLVTVDGSSGVVTVHP